MSPLLIPLVSLVSSIALAAPATAQTAEAMRRAPRAPAPAAIAQPPAPPAWPASPASAPAPQAQAAWAPYAAPAAPSAPAAPPEPPAQDARPPVPALAPRAPAPAHALWSGRRAAELSPLRKELEIMRLVLESKVFDRRVGPGLGLAGPFYALDGNQAQAYYVAGDGPHFVLRTRDAVAPCAPAEAAREPGLWEQALASVEGRPLDATVRAGEPLVYEPDKIERVRRSILDACVLFGQNVAEFPDDESITVVVRGGMPTAVASPGGGAINGSGGGATGGASTGTINGGTSHGSGAAGGGGTSHAPDAAQPGTGTVYVSGAAVGDVGVAVADGYLDAVRALSHGAASTGGETVLTVRVRLADARAAAAGRMTLEQLAASATVGQY